MNKPYRVQCLDAIYDSKDGFLVLNLKFLDLNEIKIVAFHKDDFQFKGKPGVPDFEMEHTGKLMKGKLFSLVIEDDPNRKELNSNDQAKYTKMFNERISEEMAKTVDGLSDDEKQIARKIYRLGQEGKLDFVKMYESEKSFHDKYGDV